MHADTSPPPPLLALEEPRDLCTIFFLCLSAEHLIAIDIEKQLEIDRDRARDRDDRCRCRYRYSHIHIDINMQGIVQMQLGTAAILSGNSSPMNSFQKQHWAFKEAMT